MSNTMKINEGGMDFTFEPTITIPLDRYNELIRKEVGYEVRRAELMKMNYTHSAEDTVLYQLDKKVVEPVEDDF